MAYRKAARVVVESVARHRVATIEIIDLAMPFIAARDAGDIYHTAEKPSVLRAKPVSDDVYVLHTGKRDALTKR